MDRRAVRGQAVFQGMRGVLRCLGVHKPQQKVPRVRSYSGTYVIQQQQHEARYTLAYVGNLACLERFGFSWLRGWCMHVPSQLLAGTVQ